jgi:hypothetical protein
VKEEFETQSHKGLGEDMLPFAGDSFSVFSVTLCFKNSFLNESRTKER